MAWTLEHFQRGGHVDPERLARPAIIALADRIARDAGMPGVRCQFTPGSYAHDAGLAVDIQPGPGNLEGMRRLRDVVLALDWDHHGIRYAAALAVEYGGSWGGKTRARRQTAPYTGTDGWHMNHLHVDVHPDAIPRPIDTDDDEELSEDDMKQLDDIEDDLGRLKTATERNERRLDATLTLLAEVAGALEGADLAAARKRAEQTNAAVGRLEKQARG